MSFGLVQLEQGTNNYDVFIGYTSCPYTMKCPEDENSDKCNSTEASFEFTVGDSTNEKGKFKVMNLFQVKHLPSKQQHFFAISCSS